MKYFFVSALALLLGLSACDSRKAETKTWSIEVDFPATTVDLGSHTLQADLKESAKAFATANKLDPEAITAVELTSAELLVEGEQTFEGIEQISLQFTATDAGAQQVGSTPKGFDDKQKTAKLDLAENAKNLAEVLSKDKVTVVFDLNSDEGKEEEHTFKAKFTFNLTAKLKS